MPSDPKVWIVLIVVAGCAIGLALWFRGTIRVRFRGNSLDVEPSHDPNRVVVGEGLELTNAKVGDVAGVKTDVASAASGAAQNIDVLRNAKISGGEVQDIVGIKQTGGARPAPKPSEEEDNKKEDK